MWSNCGHGTQSRTRICTNPAQKYRGIYCTEENTEIRPCSRRRRCDSPLPNNGGRSCVGEAVEDVMCEARGTGGTQNRKRTCDNPTPSYGGTSCPGQDLMVRSCNRLSTGTIRGQLSNQNIGTIHLNANLSTSASNLSTNYEFHLTDVPIERSQCSQALTEIYFPGTGYAAKEVSGASSGHTIMDTLNGITWESVGQFADGSTMKMSQSVLRSNDSVVSPSNKSIVHLTTDIYLSRSCTSSLIDPKTTSSPEVELHDFHENLVQ
ncbi:unnamed protein product [Schistosoma mattheei]|uniref:Uncharacterized protein n=1 Tax=Schistosoma mattheei TaxID=31246 RepID=A0A183PJ17_9TREM|nr:unnamed protein product [Schistosoma mattheei]